MVSFVFIANGQFGANCIACLDGSEAAKVELVVSDPRIATMADPVARICQERGIRHLVSTDINAEDIVSEVRLAEPDCMISAYNMQIIKDQLLAIPRRITINFHNAILPRYGGVNAYSWAIINGETVHGVTWHCVDSGIDTGDIISQATMRIEETDTPISLTRKGAVLGVQLFEQMLPHLISGSVERIVQSRADALYYSRKDSPNRGKLNCSSTFLELERLVRGLNFYPFDNSFVYATMSFGGVSFHPLKIVRSRQLPSQAVPGRIERIFEDVLEVQSSDAVFSVVDVLSPEKQPVCVRDLVELLGMKVGDVVD